MQEKKYCPLFQEYKLSLNIYILWKLVNYLNNLKFMIYLKIINVKIL